MKVRMRQAILGSFYYNPQTGAGYQSGVEKGQVVDLSPEGCLREVTAGRAQTDLTGALGRIEPANPAQLADLRSDIAVDARRTKR